MKRFILFLANRKLSHAWARLDRINKDMAELEGERRDALLLVVRASNGRHRIENKWCRK